MMKRPQNGIYIIQGEISLVVTAMRRTSRWTSHSHQDDESDPLLSSFSQLKDVLNSIADLDEIEPNSFLGPFLEVIRSEDTTGPITGLALTSVNKFLSYGLVDPSTETAPAAIENIADAVTHARFVGTDPGSDEVVLMKILHVLRTLLLSPAGALLTNESVCEIMQSCFRICFEMRLSELLRKSAEHTLMDMVQLLFSRLPQFKEDPKWLANMKKLKMRTGGVDPSRMGRKKRSPKPRQKRPHPKPQPVLPEIEGDGKNEDVIKSGDVETPSESMTEDAVSESPGQGEGVAYVEAPRHRLATTPATPGEDGVIDIAQKFQDASEKESHLRKAQEISDAGIAPSLEDTSVQVTESGSIHGTESSTDQSQLTSESSSHIMLAIPGEEEIIRKSPSEAELNDESDQLSVKSEIGDDSESVNSMIDSTDDYVNTQGVRFTSQHLQKEGSGPLLPYGLPCVRELFRFLISLTNPLDRHNTDVMIHMGLNLLAVALESGADYIGQYNSLLFLVKDEMCRHLFLLLQTERLSIFSASLRVCFLLFESVRSHLKLQLEFYLTKLSDIIVSDSIRISHEMREIALESIVQLWRIPGLVTELYINYDCDMHCSNLFEDLTKLLSKNAFPVQGLFSTHLLSLDALLTVIDSIEQHCHSRILSATKPTEKSEGSTDLPTISQSEHEVTKETPFVGPPTSGHDMAQKLASQSRENLTQDVATSSKSNENVQSRKTPHIRPNRMKVCDKIPSLEDIFTIKQRKKLYYTGTDQFNVKPSKGITYLQEKGLLKSPLDVGNVVMFLRENPKLDKAMIGEYVSNKKNKKTLEAFVKSFNFEDLRVDEALRQYLEAFRLPGEAPVISYLIEHFSDHWFKSNGEPFVNVDAAFTLAYAVIMLNVDQHNHNAKKQNIPMTVNEFRKNLKSCNGGQDFEQDMLEEIYNAIRNEEIVMPAEHTGLVRENYLWKVLLRRGTTKDGSFMHLPSGSFDHDLFTLIWGPTVAALSFVFDKSSDDSIIQKAIAGFRKCAMISAHYGMSDVFDNLVISLCKFTTLLSSAESPENLPVAFGSNNKAQLAARTVFGLAHRHGDILREGWKNIMDCMLQLYRAKLLPKGLIEVEDFIDPSGKICIMKEESAAAQRSEGVLSSFYSYFTSEPVTTKGPTPEEQEASKLAHSCIQDCHLEQLITESKFLREDSLTELVKALIMASQGPDAHESTETSFDEDASVFFLELLIRVVLQNRDRVTPIWQAVRDHMYTLLVNSNDHTFLVERTVVGLLRLSIRLLRREEIASQVLTSLRILLMMKPSVIHSCARQISYAQHELLRTNAANIHTGQDWFTLFTLLEVSGAGANPPPLLQVCPGVEMSEAINDAGAQSDSELPSGSIGDNYSDRGYTSDSELYDSQSRTNRSASPIEVKPVPGNGSWLLVNKDNQSQIKDDPPASVTRPIIPPNQFSIELSEDLYYCDSKALLKSAETLSFLVRDAAHVTPLNFESCVHAIRTFTEASLNGGRQRTPLHGKQSTKVQHKLHKNKRSKKDINKMKKSNSSPSHLHSADCSDEEGEGEGTASGLASLSIQLLDLMHTLHTRAASIFTSWAQEEVPGEEREVIDAGHSALWSKCWCPLLQGIARLCCDTRRQVRSQALTYLQRALLVHDLQTLSASEWEACFNKVLFPLLTKLLESISPQDPTGMEETRMRASTLLCKVFLQHLSPLLSLSTFTALWLTILDFMDKYMHADNSDLLSEAIPESLKNMLLVMDTASIFQTGDGGESQLWKLTWHRIDAILPHLKGELFKPRETEASSVVTQQPPSDNATSPSDNPQEGSTYPQQQPVEDVPLEGVTVVNDHNECVNVEERSDYSVDVPSSQPHMALSSYLMHTPSSTMVGAPVHKANLRASPTPSVPLLLNPDIMQSTSIPFISPQTTMEQQERRQMTESP